MKKIVKVLFVLGTIALIFALAGCKNPAGGSGGGDGIVLTIECYQDDKTSPATTEQMTEFSIGSYPGGTVSGNIITFTQSQFETLRTTYAGTFPGVTATSTIEEVIDAFVAIMPDAHEKIDSQSLKAFYVET